MLRSSYYGPGQAKIYLECFQTNFKGVLVLQFLSVYECFTVSSVIILVFYSHINVHDWIIWILCATSVRYSVPSRFLDEYRNWTNCTFGLYPSSGVSKNWGI